MRTTIAFGLILALGIGAPARALDAQTPSSGAAYDPWTAEEIENLLAPIALYPDPILAQVFIAATYPDQIAAAAAYVRTYGTAGLDQQPWEISVKAVAHYPPVLNLMAEGEDWSVALGQAYAAQPRDVMHGVQSLRRMANAHGNLVSTDQQRVVVEREVIRIEPAQPRVIYVPTYDPAVVYFRPVYVVRAHPAYWTWGMGYPVGAWLTYDFDWYGHNIYYHGWHRGPRWVVVSRPWVVINPIYVSPRHTTIVINRTVVRRPVNVYNLRHYTVVHRNTNFDRRWNGYDRRDVGRNDRRDFDRRDDRSDWGRDIDRRNDGRRVAPVPTNRGNNGNNGNSGRRVGSPTAGETDGGRRVGPPSGGADNGRRNVAQGPQGSADRRVTPLAGAPVRRAEAVPTPTATSRTQGGVQATRAAADRMGDRSATRTQSQSSNGTWNPRSSAPTRSVEAPRAGQMTTPRPTAAPRVPTAARQGQAAPARSSTQPGGRTQPAPARASAPSGGRAQPAPARSSAPSGGRAQAAPARSSAPAASARGATQRSSGGAARSSGSQGGSGSARASGGRGGSRPE
jgi:hypothetical protein